MLLRQLGPDRARIALYALVVLFHLVTLPVEFDASRRAMGQLEKLGITSDGHGPRRRPQRAVRRRDDLRGRRPGASLSQLAVLRVRLPGPAQLAAAETVRARPPAQIAAWQRNARMHGPACGLAGSVRSARRFVTGFAYRRVGTRCLRANSLPGSLFARMARSCVGVWPDPCGARVFRDGFRVPGASRNVPQGARMSRAARALRRAGRLPARRGTTGRGGGRRRPAASARRSGRRPRRSTPAGGPPAGGRCTASTSCGSSPPRPAWPSCTTSRGTSSSRTISSPEASTIGR